MVLEALVLVVTLQHKHFIRDFFKFTYTLDGLHINFRYLFYDTSNQTKGGQYKMITTVLTGHSFKYRRLLTGEENVEDVQTDKHIPYEQNELQQTLEKYDSKKFEL